jgi:hypothetical protein
MKNRDTNTTLAADTAIAGTAFPATRGHGRKNGSPTGPELTKTPNPQKPRKPRIYGNDV